MSPHYFYDKNASSPELRKSNQQNNFSVMKAYGLPKTTDTESECLAKVRKLYQKLVTK